MSPQALRPFKLSKHLCNKSGHCDKCLHCCFFIHINLLLSVYACKKQGCRKPSDSLLLVVIRIFLIICFLCKFIQKHRTLTYFAMLSCFIHLKIFCYRVFERQKCQINKTKTCRCQKKKIYWGKYFIFPSADRQIG